jgi:hypothetical protein
MARDKLITIRIEGEKRDAFNQLAKAQNTDTASLLYDFISGCLSGTLDIKLVTGKGNRLDNQIDTNRLDKLEATTQRIDNQLDTIAKKLNDYVEAFDDRLNDCGRELSEKMISLEHRLKTLSIQLDIQQDRQGETPDMGTVATVETVYTVEAAIEKVEAVTDTVETAIDTVESDSSIEPVTGAIGPVRGDSDSIDTEPGEAVTKTIGDKPWYTIDDLLDCHYPGWPETKEGLRKKAKREHWPKRTRRGSKGNPYEYQAVLPD